MRPGKPAKTDAIGRSCWCSSSATSVIGVNVGNYATTLALGCDAALRSLFGFRMCRRDNRMGPTVRRRQWVGGLLAAVSFYALAV